MLHRRPHLTTCLGKLMEGVQRNLEPKNRDKFTQVGYLPLRHGVMAPEVLWPYL